MGDDFVYHDSVGIKTFSPRSVSGVFDICLLSPLLRDLLRHAPLIPAPDDHSWGFNDWTHPDIGSNAPMIGSVTDWRDIWADVIGDGSTITKGNMLLHINKWWDGMVGLCHPIQTNLDPGSTGQRTEWWYTTRWGQWALLVMDSRTHMRDAGATNNAYLGDVQDAAISVAIASETAPSMLIFHNSPVGDIQANTDNLMGFPVERERFFSYLRAYHGQIVFLHSDRHWPRIGTELATTTVTGSTGPVPQVAAEIVMHPTGQSGVNLDTFGGWPILGDDKGVFNDATHWVLRWNNTAGPGADPTPVSIPTSATGPGVLDYHLQAHICLNTGVFEIRDGFTGLIATDQADGSGPALAQIMVGGGGSSALSQWFALGNDHPPSPDELTEFLVTGGMN